MNATTGIEWTDATLRAGLWSEPRPGGGWTLTLKDRKGGDMTEWPADLRVREFPTPAGGKP